MPAETVIREYSDMVYRIAFARTGNKADADDIYQEVFLRYIRRKPEFRSEEHAKAWFIKVSVNCARKFMSKNQKNAETLIPIHGIIWNFIAAMLRSSMPTKCIRPSFSCMAEQTPMFP